MAYNIVTVTYFLSRFFYRYNAFAVNYLLFGDCLTIHILIITITIISLKYLTQTYIFDTSLLVGRYLLILFIYYLLDICYSLRLPIRIELLTRSICLNSGET